MVAQLALLPNASPRRSLPLLTGSAMRKWRACPRLYRYEQIDLVRPVHESAAVDFGKLMHAALEAWWKSAKAARFEQCQACGGSGNMWWNEALLHPADACTACGGTGNACTATWLATATAVIWQATMDDPWRRARANALLLGYHLRWQDMTWDGEPLEVLGVEVEFRASLVNPETGWASKTWDRGGKIDCIVRGRVTGRVWILETKTTSEDFGPGTPYRDKLVLDPQISHYMVGARSLGYEPAGCIYDVLKRPEQKPLEATPIDKRKWTKGTKNNPAHLYLNQRTTDETVDEYYARICTDIAGHVEDWYARLHVVRIGDEERRSAANDWALGHMIHHAEYQLKQGVDMFYQNTDSCGRWSQRCAFLDVCTGLATLDDSRFRRAERAHEELSAPEGAASAPAASDAAE